MRTVLIALSIVAPFIGLTGGRVLLNQLLHANPLAVAAAVFVLLGHRDAPPFGRWTTSWRLGRAHRLAWPDDPASPSTADPGRAASRSQPSPPRQVRASAAARPRRATGRCLRPTSRSTPTNSKPQARCSPMDGSLWPAIRAMTEWKPWAGPGSTVRPGAPGRRPGPAGARRRTRSSRPWRRRPIGPGTATGPEPEHRLVVGSDVPPTSPARPPRWRVDAPVVESHACCSSPGPGDDVERVGAAEHLDVVDGPDASASPGRPVGSASADGTALAAGVTSSPDGAGVGAVRCSWLSLTVAWPNGRGAPLAQSAEHSHGKAGVVGSIPTGGSPLAA